MISAYAATRAGKKAVQEQLLRHAQRLLDRATSRTLLVTDDPDTVVRRAVEVGATEKSPVRDEHGWRLGRIVDPFGHEWEIGKPIGPWPPDLATAG